MVMELDEVRINNYYSTKTVSEFPDGESGDSTPVKNKRTIRTDELIQKLKEDPLETSLDYCTKWIIQLSYMT